MIFRLCSSIRGFGIMALVCLTAGLFPLMVQAAGDSVTVGDTGRNHGSTPVRATVLAESTPPARGTGQVQIDSAGRNELLAYIREKHGPDPGLINGIQFYNRYRQVKHHPYYRSEAFSRGSVTLSGREYEDVLLNYDLYTQEVILEYRGWNGGVGKIILISPHIDAFRLGGNRFEKLSLTEEGPLFYQVIATDDKDEATFYIHWEKQIVPNSNDLDYPNYFSESRGDFLLDYSGTLHRFSNRSSFKSIFSGDTRKQIRKYLVRNRFRFRKATAPELNRLLEFIVRLPQTAQKH
jgi:hypothetical protein